MLTVMMSPAITGQPQSRTNVTGTTATFSATASGSTPLSYQWRLNTTNLTNGGRVSGVTTGTLTISNVQPADAGGYTLVVTNGAGAAISAVAVLTVMMPPGITTQPQSRTNLTGTTATFSATASGSTPLSYQWRLNTTNLTNGSQLSGVTTGTLTISNVQTADAGSYTLVVTNGAGAAISAVAVLTVMMPPGITTQPQSRTNLTGTTATFSATASGSTPLSYQWRLNATNLTNGGRVSGVTTGTLTISNVQPADAGSYALVATNGAGTATSAVAVLTVMMPPA